jgi:hypothetical protein
VAGVAGLALVHRCGAGIADFRAVRVGDGGGGFPDRSRCRGCLGCGLKLRGGTFVDRLLSRGASSTGASSRTGSSAGASAVVGSGVEVVIEDAVLDEVVMVDTVVWTRWCCRHLYCRLRQ